MYGRTSGKVRDGSRAFIYGNFTLTDPGCYTILEFNDIVRMYVLVSPEMLECGLLGRLVNFA